MKASKKLMRIYNAWHWHNVLGKIEIYVYDDIFSRSNNQLYNCLTQFIKYLMKCLRFGHIYGTGFFLFISYPSPSF